MAASASPSPEQLASPSTSTAELSVTSSVAAASPPLHSSPALVLPQNGTDSSLRTQRWPRLSRSPPVAAGLPQRPPRLGSLPSPCAAIPSLPGAGRPPGRTRHAGPRPLVPAPWPELAWTAAPATAAPCPPPLLPVVARHGRKKKTGGGERRIRWATRVILCPLTRHCHVTDPLVINVSQIGPCSSNLHNFSTVTLIEPLRERTVRRFVPQLHRTSSWSLRHPKKATIPTCMIVMQ
ncbi:formin-like protein 6 [Triticum dicoccoides]|uniref:formin-like protein 6 n=1 Tax=Triticum dicoccoides TaxID=85692 RepID=UPI00188F3F7F|nr:formin-like protein 6 [Triticum dicoccoides]